VLTLLSIPRKKKEEPCGCQELRLYVETVLLGRIRMEMGRGTGARGIPVTKYLKFATLDFDSHPGFILHTLLPSVVHEEQPRPTFQLWCLTGRFIPFSVFNFHFVSSFRNNAGLRYAERVGAITF
jgi:hypothetical protein